MDIIFGISNLTHDFIKINFGLNLIELKKKLKTANKIEKNNLKNNLKKIKKNKNKINLN